MTWTTAVLVLLVPFFLTTRAHAADGLDFVGVDRDDTPGIDALAAPLGVAVSPDGIHVYVTAFADDGVMVFARDPALGTLAGVESQRQGVNGVQGLTGPVAVVVTSDGRNVYVASQTDDSVVAFARDGASGRLSFVESQRDGVGTVDGLRGALAIATSSDGAHVYVAGRLDDAIAVFARDATTGRLTFVEVQKDGVGGVTGLGRPSGLAMSPDGAHLYVASQVGNSVTVFTRAPATGALAFVESQQDGVAGVTGLASTTSVAVTPDGAHVYAGGRLDGTLAMFRRDAATGRLTFLGAREEGVDGVTGLAGAAAVTVDPTGRDVFVASASGGAVTSFARDATSGLLDFVQTRRDGTGDIDGLGGAGGLAVSPDGANVYVTGFLDNAVATFAVVPVGGGCAPRPDRGCRRPVKPRKAPLVLRQRSGDTKDSLLWKWRKGAETSTADLGDPRTTTAYFLCLYAEQTGAPTLVVRAGAAPGAGWKSTHGGGFAYRSKDGLPDGVRRVVLKPGAAGKASILAKAAGPSLRLPSLPLGAPVRMQVTASNGQCWEAGYASARKNTTTQFKATSD